MDFINFIKQLFVYDPKNPILFNSGTFFFLFIFFLLSYIFLRKEKLLISLYVVAFSIFFYYKSSGFYVVLLVFVILKDYYSAILVTQIKNRLHRKIILISSLTLSLGILGYYKYTNFTLDTISLIINTNFQFQDIFLPIGISFFTFQSISYILDVYWGKLKPTNNMLDYAFYLSFFPQLVAGPIVKANHFLPQLEKPVNITKVLVYKGLYLILAGLFKKAVIADYISQYNDLIFSDPSHYTGFENLMAVYGYSLQIFCDFSGYSDMAIGLGYMLGYDLDINFNMPYKATNITTFWHKWHISLSTWLRSYLYIPLGGNRKGKIRTYINLMLTMLIGGLWHGASWKFVFWGGLHGVGLAVHKGLMKYLDNERFNKKIWIFASWFITFHFVTFLWIFFRAKDFTTSWQVVAQIFTAFDCSYIIPFFQNREIWIVLFLIGFVTHFLSDKYVNSLKQKFVETPVYFKFIAIVVIVQLAIQFKSQDVQPFIYFQF